MEHPDRPRVLPPRPSPRARARASRKVHGKSRGVAVNIPFSVFPPAFASTRGEFPTSTAEFMRRSFLEWGASQRDCVDGRGGRWRKAAQGGEGKGERGKWQELPPSGRRKVESR